MKPKGDTKCALQKCVGVWVCDFEMTDTERKSAIEWIAIFLRIVKEIQLQKYHFSFFPREVSYCFSAPPILPSRKIFF